MKVRYKITAAFVLFTVTLLAALCILTYYITDKQQQRDFYKRMHNRTSTVASLLAKLPSSSGYAFLSKLDSATNSNSLSRLTLSVYDDSGKSIYHFSRLPGDTFSVDPSLLTDARQFGTSSSSIGERQLLAVHYNHAKPITILISSIDENGSKNLSELTKTLSLAFLAAIAFTFLIGWIFSAELLRPVDKIATTVNNISANNIENRLPESTVNDEWNKLAVTFNNLLQRLQDSFELQGRFISNASHELSTPLTAVSNQIDVILQKSRTNEEYLEVLHSVRDDVQHMSALTQQLLNIARTTRGGVVNTESTRVDEILMELPSLLKKIAPNYTAKLLFDELPENEKLCMIDGNYELLLSAFRNLAENGCKYAPDHAVNISLSFTGSRITIRFSNAYQSLRPDEVDKIFQPFQRGSNAANERGYGLGLSLTRRIILLHKGEIKAAIEKENMVISVVLPSAAGGN
ncbi:HAMP domain-containing histidine kinase [Sediminibacterium roseum]|uniref:histidine kinase n=1 Tax=Sediminibacterium roseum TaxID=1978412 RepID=A0ABW9ZXP4_9BACT|nr:HAMP domain-containing sensor histidine kinase [Sediminibacterium roseum]NCI49626.1 HAMP domain-containing histidine kinase [Sediminibacterium roseum]